MTDFDLAVDLRPDHVAVVKWSRGPNNYFSAEVIAALADTLEGLAGKGARAAVLCSAGRHFCAGADFGSGGTALRLEELYGAGARLFDQPLPLVAAVQGAAVGGGLGLAMVADFRVATPQTRFVANFAKLGLHHGFGLSVTLPAAIGHQHAADLLYTGRSVRGAEALDIGLCDQLADAPDLRTAALERATTIAANAPLAVQAIRATMRRERARELRAAVTHERSEQERLFGSSDFAEGVAAAQERRTALFRGQ